MVWCSNCGKNISQPDNVDGKICCNLCGRVLDEDNFSQEATFVKNAAGQSQLSGNLVKTGGDGSASRQRTLDEAYNGMFYMSEDLGISGGHSILNPALKFYELAINRNFTKGRRKEHVQASCLYMSCRLDNKPYLLIDFSEYLRINVYVLGAVFLQLSKLLSLEEHPVIQKLVDPSLFIHRFTERLLNPSQEVSKTDDNKQKEVSETALRIVASMKRDWMQTGRKPSGLCGAALYISALSHGHKCSKSEIIKVVHICEATLTKRLIEFENTESGGLTIEEFNMKAKEIEEKGMLMDSLDMPESSGISELLCKHKGGYGPPEPFALGLCECCYREFIALSGGLNGGLEPPAFQRAERERRMAMEAASDSSENLDSSILPDPENNSKLLNSDKQRSKNMIECKAAQRAETDPTGATLQSKVIDDSSNGRMHADAPFEESESLSDIDDIEVDVYLHNEEEKKLKKIIWEEMNKEYLEEQAAKEAAELAARKAYEAKFSNCSEDVKAAQELAAAAAAAVAKSKKEKQQKRAEELKNAGPPKTAAEATKRMLDKKRLSSKINHEILDKLFDEPENKETIKKNKIESDHEDNYLNNSQEYLESEGYEDPYTEEYTEQDVIYDDYYQDDY